MGQDLIIGVVDNYTWDQIQYWSNSIDKSGFQGHKAIIAYNMDVETVNKLTSKDFMVIGCDVLDPKRGFRYESKGSIMVDRFMHIYQFLDQLDQQNNIDRVIATDVRDVVFQSNPSEWLKAHISPHAKIVIGSENLAYRDEPWGSNNLMQTFGSYFYSKLEANPIYCAGVIAGDLKSFKDMCLNVWLLCRALNPHTPGGGGPDQAALNVLLSLDVYKDKSFFLDPTTGWVLHSGTSMPAIEAGSGGIGQAYKENPHMKFNFIKRLDVKFENEEVSVNDKKVCIVHQWDRVPTWKEAFEKKFGGE